VQVVKAGKLDVQCMQGLHSHGSSYTTAEAGFYLRAAAAAPRALDVVHALHADLHRPKALADAAQALQLLSCQHWLMTAAAGAAFVAVALLCFAALQLRCDVSATKLAAAAAVVVAALQKTMLIAAAPLL
jgi:hypothetical protein